MSAEQIESTFIETERLRMAPLVASDASADYLSWLNDAEVLRYRAPKAFPSTLEDLEAFVRADRGRGELVLAVRQKEDGRHIGNVSLNTILWVHRSAELSILIGDKDAWGRGYGREIIDAVLGHAFGAMGLHRVWAESPNPAFCAAVRALGWLHEGTKREAFLVDGALVDIECFAVLAPEWRARAS